MTDVDLTGWVVPAQFPIYQRIAAISASVAPSTWCVIGGLMTELVLVEAGAESAPRTTTDGDVLAHLAVDSDVLGKIETVLTGELDMTLRVQFESAGAFASRSKNWNGSSPTGPSRRSRELRTSALATEVDPRDLARRSPHRPDLVPCEYGSVEDLVS